MFINYEGADTLRLHKKNTFSTYLLLEQGTKIDIPTIDYATGGGATNMAVGLSRLGMSVEAFFKTGDDDAGTFIRNQLTKEHVGISYCPVSFEHHTALSIIIPSIEQDYAALCYRGANRELKTQEFPLSLFTELDLLFIGPLGGHSQDLLPYLTNAATQAGVPVALNPSIQQLTHTPSFTQALASVDILIVNTYESGFLLKALLAEESVPEFSSHDSSPLLLEPYLHLGERTFSVRDVFKEIFTHGPKIAIITNGSEGVYIGTKEMILFHPSIATDTIYSLGAGDAFTSGFLGAHILGASLSDALRFGVLNATSVVSHPNAKDGLLTFKELESKASSLDRSLLLQFSY